MTTAADFAETIAALGASMEAAANGLFRLSPGYKGKEADVENKIAFHGIIFNELIAFKPQAGTIGSLAGKFSEGAVPDKMTLMRMKMAAGAVTAYAAYHRRAAALLAERYCAEANADNALFKKVVFDQIAATLTASQASGGEGEEGPLQIDIAQFEANTAAITLKAFAVPLAHLPDLAAAFDGWVAALPDIDAAAAKAVHDAFADAIAAMQQA